MSHLCLPASMAPSACFRPMWGTCPQSTYTWVREYRSDVCYTMPHVPYTPTTMAGRADYLQVGTHYQGYGMCASTSPYDVCIPLPIPQPHLWAIVVEHRRKGKRGV